MRDGTWSRPLWQMTLILTLLLMWALYSITFLILSMVDYEPVLTIILTPIPLIMFIFYFLIRKMYSEAWNCMCRSVQEPSYEIIPRLEGRMVEEGVQFTMRSKMPEGSTEPWDEVFLIGESRVIVSASAGRTTVYVGPLRKDGQEDVEMLKKVVDKALE